MFSYFPLSNKVVLYSYFKATRYRTRCLSGEEERENDRVMPTRLPSQHSARLHRWGWASWASQRCVFQAAPVQFLSPIQLATLILWLYSGRNLSDRVPSSPWVLELGLAHLKNLLTILRGVTNSPFFSFKSSSLYTWEVPFYSWAGRPGTNPFPPPQRGRDLEKDIRLRGREMGSVGNNLEYQGEDWTFCEGSGA